MKLMNKIIAVSIGLVFIAGPAFAGDKATALKDNQKLSYAMGQNLGTSIKNSGEPIELKILLDGISDAYTGNKSLMTPEEITGTLQKFADLKAGEKMAKLAEMSAKNRKAAYEFLIKNEKKKGITTTESGLQYKVIKEGKGKKPTLNDAVTVHYKGSLIDGTEFDSSYKRNKPALFQVGQVIPGWKEALQLMPVGSTYELYLPADLAYGDKGAGQLIEPGSMLIFQIELIDIGTGNKK
jgi:FKBP-type peptidyl-prolyl cis-trans isomerase